MKSKSHEPPRASRPTPGRPTAIAAAGRIEHLLDVAAEVFIENGYEGASVGEIARRANASKQTLYSRYPTKAELFLAVMSGRCERCFARISGILDPAGLWPKVSRSSPKKC